MAIREKTLEHLLFFAEFDTPEGDEASRTVARDYDAGAFFEAAPRASTECTSFDRIPYDQRGA